MKKEIWEQLEGTLLLRGANYNKYGTITRGMMSQYSMRLNQYPNDLIITTDILYNHKLDRKPQDSNQPKKGQQKDENKQEEELKKTEASFAQKKDKGNIPCFCCDRTGHTADECYKKNKIPKEDWFCHKAAVFTQELDGKSKSGDAKGDKKPQRWAGLQLQAASNSQAGSPVIEVQHKQ